jgi:hypothetical protein
MSDDSANGPEALTWLASTPNPFALASNRFESTEAAIEFVQGLYRAGAQHVAIAQDCIRDDPATLKAEGGPWADGLWVTLPDDAQKAQTVTQICRQEVESEGFPFHKSAGEKDIFLWWD